MSIRIIEPGKDLEALIQRLADVLEYVETLSKVIKLATKRHIKQEKGMASASQRVRASFRAEIEAEMKEEESKIAKVISESHDDIETLQTYRKKLEERRVKTEMEIHHLKDAIEERMKEVEQIKRRILELEEETKEWEPISFRVNHLADDLVQIARAHDGKLHLVEPVER